MEEYEKKIKKEKRKQIIFFILIILEVPITVLLMLDLYVRFIMQAGTVI